VCACALVTSSFAFVPPLSRAAVHAYIVHATYTGAHVVLHIDGLLLRRSPSPRRATEPMQQLVWFTICNSYLRPPPCRRPTKVTTRRRHPNALVRSFSLSLSLSLSHPRSRALSRPTSDLAPSLCLHSFESRRQRVREREREREKERQRGKDEVSKARSLSCIRSLLVCITHTRQQATRLTLTLLIRIPAYVAAALSQ
jgi:hypothetical protein